MRTAGWGTSAVDFTAGSRNGASCSFVYSLPNLDQPQPLRTVAILHRKQGARKVGIYILSTPQHLTNVTRYSTVTDSRTRLLSVASSGARPVDLELHQGTLQGGSSHAGSPQTSPLRFPKEKYLTPFEIQGLIKLLIYPKAKRIGVDSRHSTLLARAREVS